MEPEEIRSRVKSKVQFVEKHLGVCDMGERRIDTHGEGLVRLVKAEPGGQHLAHLPMGSRVPVPLCDEL